MVRRGRDHQATRLAAAHDEHLVGFYDSEAFLTESIVRFIEPALVADELAVVVVTREHGTRLTTALEDLGWPVGQLRARGRLQVLDAEALLPRLLVRGMPDRERFRALVGGFLAASLDAGRQVRCFGEMVNLLWEAGNVPGVLALEELWNEFLRTRPLTLFCAYPMGAFDREESEATFHEVCDAHAVVLPSERYSALPDDDARSRAVTVLQHEAVIGINERIALRQQLHQREAELQRLRALERVQARLVEAVSPSPAAAPAERWHPRPAGVAALRKTACRQVRAVLDAADCTFAPATAAPERGPAAASQLSFPVAAGGAVLGALHVQLRTPRDLDDDELGFVSAVAGLLGIGLSAQR